LTTVDRYQIDAAHLVAHSLYAYDNRGRMTGLTHSKNSTTLADYVWHYYGGGQLKQATSTADATTGNNSATIDYSYDQDGQLTDATYTAFKNSPGTEHYTFDVNGNQTNGGQQVNSDNELQTDGTYQYAFDAEGNETARWIPGVTGETVPGGNSGDQQITIYSWDNRNRLVEVDSYATAAQYTAHTPTQVVTETYDVANRWIGETVTTYSGGVGTVVENRGFVYDGNQIVLQFDKSGSGGLAATDLSKRYLWGSAVDQLLAQETTGALQNGVLQAGTVDWALTDNLGTVRDLVDYIANDVTSVVMHAVYNSFGKLANTVNPGTGQPASCLFGFTGRPFDTNTGLQNNDNRWYDPATHRWLSQDPSGFGGGDSNLYRYCGNGPTNGTDPSGLAEMRAGPPLTWWDKVHDFFIAPSGGNAQDFGLNFVQHTILNVGRELRPDTGTLAPVTRPVVSGLNRVGGEGWGAANVLGGVGSSGYHGVRSLLSDRIEAAYWRRLARENLGVSMTGLDTMRWGLDPRTTGWRDPYPVNASFWDPAKADLYNAPEGSINNLQRYGLPGLATSLEFGSQGTGQAIGLKLLGTTAKATIPVLRYTAENAPQAMRRIPGLGGMVPEMNPGAVTERAIIANGGAPGETDAFHRVYEAEKPAFQLRKGEEGLSVFDAEKVTPADVLPSFREGSLVTTQQRQLIESFGLKVEKTLGDESLPQLLRENHFEIGPGDGMTRNQFKQALKSLEQAAREKGL
jgi:RHS repeat-associated protein